MPYIARLFGEAWERRRRRVRRLAWAAVAACAVGLLTYVAFRPNVSAPGPALGIEFPAGTVARSPAAVFSQPPYMGVRCPEPNSIACDQVGLAVWLKRPAQTVTAWIDGRRLAMDRFGDQLITSAAPRREFDGYLRPAGIRSSMHVRPDPGTSTWEGDPTPVAAVSLLIDEGHHHYVTTRLRVPLMAGWG